LVEELKNIGFQYATKAGISLGIEDLKFGEKNSLIMDTEQFQLQQLNINGWMLVVSALIRHRTSER
jgi:hypothetical protein